jgi:polyhydroxyalkanoate synthesis regulator phasin
MADDVTNVAAALATLRGEMAAGFERLDGKLNLISQAQATVAKDIDAVSARVTTLEGRVTALEERRWPLGPVAAVSGVVSAIAAVAMYIIAK